MVESKQQNSIVPYKAEYYRLYHYPLCPFSRSIRFLFNYYAIEHIQIVENFWEKREKFIALNPTGEVPFLAIKRINIDDTTKHSLVWSHSVIKDWIRDKMKNNIIDIDEFQDKIEINKMTYWFDVKFYNDVTKHILNERVYTWYKSQITPDAQLLKIARLNLENHLKFLETVLTKRDYVATNEFSTADISASMQLSCLDYLGEINWKTYPMIKEWYMIIKSKPSFREFLYDNISNFKAPMWYRELDF
ncbi:MAG: hypothetical protein RL208_217 [Pseudomonadota bacterium]|jgi:glutathione S-transferase